MRAKRKTQLLKRAKRRKKWLLIVMMAEVTRFIFNIKILIIIYNL
jgi:hypothetical protein